MFIQVFTKSTIDTLNWETVKNGEQLKQYYKPLIKNDSQVYVNNSSHIVDLLQVNDELFPISIGKKSPKGTCYLFSFLAQYVDYTREEILEDDKYSALQKNIVKFLFPLLKPIGQILGLENVVFVNNLFLATNLYDNPSILSHPKVLEYLKAQYSNKTIAFRSINDSTDEHLLENLKENGAIPLVCRQIYILNPENDSYKKKRPVIQDRKLWEKTEVLYWDKVSLFKPNEVDTALDFYNDLYLKKYSKLNPSFTPKFLENTCKGGVLDYYFLREKEGNSPVAIQAVEKRNHVICTPFIGYDQQKPKKMGLYRLMNHQLTELAETENKTLNMSSGAASFKKQRGGIPQFDYNLVICDHLPKRKQFVWKKIFHYSETTVKPTMQKLGV